ncbi:hypothetical protein UFOVP581_25 [uncultured Caudovirales phage]|uniref:Uncharacterized protein n=1 Tax=uncultured Caudovirales phage TaxID=2100421 RepID=A0A6J5PAP2_9CAUD|nr:hypothetical protein UFOVP581_25 [uncultured Caudovirales phage]
MTVSIKNIVPAKFAENAQTTQYTAALVKAVIDKFTATNTSASNASIDVNLTLGGAAAGSNLIIKSRVLLPNETYTFPELVGHVLEPTGTISTIASTASAIVIRASGREIS